jgi:flagellar hook-basal body complex protein FliE
LIDALSPLGGIGSRSFLDGPATTGASAPAADFGASLAKAISSAASDTVASLQNADKISMTALQGGDVTTREVVDSVMSAERSLQTAIAIRDKIVTAYLEVSRMAI